MKEFTISDIEKVEKIAFVTGVEQYWCQITLKGGSTPCNFLAEPKSTIRLSRELYDSIKEGTHGEPNHGTGEWYTTQPIEQLELEANARAQRDDLLLRSDYTDTAVQQAKMSEGQKTAWANYRDALRDVPNQVNFPYHVEWPVKPS
jgi:hypothetical protein